MRATLLLPLFGLPILTALAQSIVITPIPAFTVTTSIAGTAQTLKVPVPPTALPELASIQCDDTDLQFAIDSFCFNEVGIEVPSTYARNGLTVGKFRVSVQAFCDPPMWVPNLQCRSRQVGTCLENATVGGLGYAFYEAASW